MFTSSPPFGWQNYSAWKGFCRFCQDRVNCNLQAQPNLKPTRSNALDLHAATHSVATKAPKATSAASTTKDEAPKVESPAAEKENLHDQLWFIDIILESGTAPRKQEAQRRAFKGNKKKIEQEQAQPRSQKKYQKKQKAFL